MFVMSKHFVSLDIASLQTGQVLAKIVGVLIDVNNLQIVGFRVAAKNIHLHQPVLLLGDVRQFAKDCIIIDSVDSISEAADIIRLRPIVSAGFELQKKLVVTESGKRLGKVSDYSIDLSSLVIQKLHVRPMFPVSITKETLVIDRSQVVEVTIAQITVHDAYVKEGKKIRSRATAIPVGMQVKACHKLNLPQSGPKP